MLTEMTVRKRAGVNQPSETSRFPSCVETGVLGAAPGLMGVLQALETVKTIAGFPPSLHQKLLMVDVLENDFTAIEIDGIQSCSLCKII